MILLTWDELMRPAMIGEPVWSEGKHRWYLVADSALDNRSWVDLTDACGKITRIIEHDLRVYKLSKERGE